MRNNEIEINGIYWTRLRRGWVQVQVTARTLTTHGRRSRVAWEVSRPDGGKPLMPRRASALYMTKPGALQSGNGRPDLIVIDDPVNDSPSTPEQRARIMHWYQTVLAPAAETNPHVIIPELPPEHPPNFRCTVEPYQPTAGRLPWPAPPEPPPGSCQHCGGSGVDAAGGLRAPSFCLCPAGLRAKEQHF